MRNAQTREKQKRWINELKYEYRRKHEKEEER